MMNIKTIICPALKSFVKYWDEWHKDWYTTASSKAPMLTPIKCWPIPAGNGGNINEIWRYFPEPYWGNPYPTELTAVFLNLNPGGGGDDQDIKISTKDPIATYLAKHQIYVDTVEALINIPCNPTTDWFIKKRVHWINCLLYNLNKGNDKTIKNIMAGELVPWHTKNVSEIKMYIGTNINLIKAHCIEPLAVISQCATLKGIVFCRGVEIAHTLTKLTKEKASYTSLDKHRIHIYEYFDAIFIVFVGGRDMDFPNPCKDYVSSRSNNTVSVSEIVNDCLIKSAIK